MQKTQSPILQVEDLTISFGKDSNKTTAVQSSSFELFQGETLAIVGESGSGKSVSSLAIMKLLPAPPANYEQGAIKYIEKGNEVDLTQLSEKGIIQYRGAKIAMIFQEPMSALNPSQRCGEQVAEMLKIHTALSDKEQKQAILKQFAAVDLPNPERIYKSYPHQLSGGQLQRIMIAMAIICEPDILIADEPTTALDVTIQAKIIELLQTLKETTNISTIFITHELGLVSKIADRVLVMHRGRIVEQGTIDQVFNHPQESYTKGLIACKPPLNRRYSRLPTIKDFTESNQSIAETVAPLVESRSQFDHRLTDLDSRPVLLSAQNIKKQYITEKSFWGKPTKWLDAVDDVSFQIRKGETLGLVGESGCGKSTLAKVIMRLIPSTAGSVHFDDKDIFSLSESEMRKARKDYQIIFQDPYGSLNPRMKIGKAIMEPLDIHGIGHSKRDRRDICMDLLQKVGLQPDHFDRYPHQFSGGQRQRICIARAVGLKPKFILCDESVSALDVSVQAQVLNLLKDLQEELGLSYLFISHDLSVVKFISDRIMVMQAGKIVERGDAETIINDPQELYTQSLIAAIP